MPGARSCNYHVSVPSGHPQEGAAQQECRAAQWLEVPADWEQLKSGTSVRWSDKESAPHHLGKRLLMVSESCAGTGNRFNLVIKLQHLVPWVP